MREERKQVSRRSWMLIALVAILAGVVIGPFLYLNVFRDEAPEPLGFSDITTTSAAPGASTADGAPSFATIDGTWSIAAGSQAGYRAQEVLFGQDADTVGRTEDVSGEMTIAGNAVEAASFVVDLTTVESDSDNRDRQFHGRIMDTAQFPEARFELTTPIILDAVPAADAEITLEATGDFTIRGVTKSVTFELAARRSGDAIQVTATIPVKWSDFEIPDPSFGPAQVQDNGSMELALSFERA